MKKAWAEMHEGADIRIPKVFRFIIKFVSPVYLIGLLLFWGIQDGIPILLMKSKNPADVPFLWGSRIMMLGLVVLCLILTAIAYKKGTIRYEEKSEPKTKS
jgi:hypothetical protein